MEEALATFRRLGNGFWLHDALLAVSDRWLNRGDLHRAQASLTEARDEWHRAGGEPRWRDLARAGYLQLMQGDVAGGRRSLGEANQMAGRNGEWGPSYLEAAILREEDRLDEARAVIERNLDRFQSPYDRHYRLGQQILIAQLDCDQRKERDGLGRIDQARVPHACDPPEFAFDRAVEATCLLQLDDIDGADLATREGLTAANQASAFSERIDNAMNLALVQSARGDRRAVPVLRALVAEAEPRLYLSALEVRLALAKAAVDAGLFDGPKRLSALEAKQRARGSSGSLGLPGRLSTGQPHRTDGKPIEDPNVSAVRSGRALRSRLVLKDDPQRESRICQSGS